MGGRIKVAPTVAGVELPLPESGEQKPSPQDGAALPVARANGEKQAKRSNKSAADKPKEKKTEEKTKKKQEKKKRKEAEPPKQKLSDKLKMKVWNLIPQDIRETLVMFSEMLDAALGKGPYMFMHMSNCPVHKSTLV